MKDTIKLYCRNTNTSHDLPVGISLREAFELLDLQLSHRVVCAKVNYVTEGLNYRIYNSKDVEFITPADPSGMRAYIRSLCFILYKAIRDTLSNGELIVEHPLSKGLFCHITSNGKKVHPADIDRIRTRMQEIINANIPFRRCECRTEEAIDLFTQMGFKDKVRLLKSTKSLYTYYYKLDNEIDYYYGCLIPSTGYIQLFDLQPLNSGVLLIGPNRNNPAEMEQTTPQPKMLKTFEEHNHFNKVIGLHNIGSLNQAIANGSASDIIKVTEALQERKISSIADEIVKRKEVRVVLIAGPSSSGKTTFSKRLEVQLWTNLLKPVALSMDNYFIDREDTPIDENGEHDFESLYALDLPLFNQQVNELLEGKEIYIPTYSFEKGTKEFTGKKMKLNHNSILIIEGIHALNPVLLDSIPNNRKFKIYASALTTISLDDHNWIPTTDNRLIRRIVRDYKYRAYSAKNTLARWASVRRGEDKWIFPYQENADAMFNSALLYELAVLKRHAEPILQEVPHNCPEYAEAARLLRFLRYISPIYDDELPPTSLLREFFGGSSFRY